MARLEQEQQITLLRRIKVGSYTQNEVTSFKINAS